LLTPRQIAAVLRAARRWPVASTAEITIEANPDDRSRAYYEAIRAAGVNRLSLGVQSFDDALLRRLGRRHDAAAAADAVRLARQAGFDNLSLDLMFALPDQTLAGWRDSVDRAIDLGPEHLSLYNLTVEPDTPFGAWQAAGKLIVPDDDLAADMYQLAIERLDAAGYAHYEISNWARRDPNRDLRAQHNLRYWRNQTYFGVGAGAHSCFGGFRYANLRTPGRYIAQVLNGASPLDSAERITRATAMEETMMLGLRLAEGVSDGDFRARFGAGLRPTYGNVLDELIALGLVAWADGEGDERLQLTQRGRFLGNEVFCRFLSDG
jgi:oxygen-independent coproporphyrinogen-3 oxidase